MAVGVQKAWSTTASSNGSADTNVNFAEGQLAPTLNNSSRATMAAIKGWSNQISGGCTCAGSSNAYTITSDAAAAISTAYGAGMMFMLKANHTNTGAATLNVDSVGAVAIKTSDGGDVVAGDIVSGGLYLLAYNATGPRFDLIGTFAGGSFQPLDATLTGVAGLSFSTTNAYFRATDVDTFVAESASSFRTGLGLGTAALATIGTSGDTVPKNNTANTWSAIQSASNGAGRSQIRPSGDIQAYRSGGTTGYYFFNSADTAYFGFDATNFTAVTASGAGRMTIDAANVVTTNSTDTLSNKTLSSPTLSGTVGGSPTFSGPLTLSYASGTALTISHPGNQVFGAALTIKTSGGSDNPRQVFEYYNGGSPKRWSIGNSGSDFGIFEDGSSSGFGTARFVLTAGGGMQARIRSLVDTSGTLTASSANTAGQATGTVTVPSGVFSANDVVIIRAGSGTFTLTQGSGLTMHLHGTASTGSRTVAVYGVVAIQFTSSTECIVSGDVS